MTLHPTRPSVRHKLAARIQASLLGLLLLLAVPTQAQVLPEQEYAPGQTQQILLPNQEYTESHTDLQVQVQGGPIQIKRTWLNGRWYTNPAWVDLRFHFDPLDHSIKSISRAGSLYSRGSSSDTVYRFDTNNQISTITDASASISGWRWSNPSGDWIQYDALGRIKSYGNAVLTQAQFIYNAAGQRTQIQDSQGRTVLSFTYNAQDLLERISSHDGRSVSYEWSGTNLSQVTNVRGHHWRYQYSAKGQISQRTDPLGASINLSYSDNNAAAEPEMGSGRQAAAHNSQTNASTPGVISSAGPIIVRGISRVDQYQDELNASTLYRLSYDKSKREYTNEVSEASGAKQSKTYNAAGRLLKVEQNGAVQYSRSSQTSSGVRQDKSVDARGNTTTTYFDSHKRPIKIIHADGSVESFEYNAAGYKTQHSNAQGVVTTWSYNAKHQPIEQVEAKGKPEQRTSRWSYNNVGQMISTSVGAGDGLGADAISQSYEYDSWGNRSKTIDGQGQSTHYRHNAQGQVIEQTNAQGHTWRVEYDAAGNAVKAINPQGAEQSFTVDERNRRTASTDALGRSSQTRYNGKGQITQQSNALGQTTGYSYNAAGQLTTITSPSGLASQQSYDSEGRIAQSTDAAGNITQYEYGAADTPLAGLLQAIQYPSYREEYKYDQTGRQTQVSQVVVNSQNQTERLERYFSYDALGQLVGEIDPAGNATQTEYDALGRVIKTTDSTNQSTSQSWDAHDQRTSLTDAKGNTHQFSYDKAGRLTKESRPSGAASQYRYNALGQLQEREDAAGNIKQYRYDSADQPIEEKHFSAGHNPTTAQPEQSITYRYNADGQLTGYSQKDSQERLISQAEYTLDALGRQISETIQYGAGAGTGIDPATPIGKTITRSYNADGQTSSQGYPDGTTSRYQYANGQLKTATLPNSQAITWSNYQWQRAQHIQYPNATKTLSFDALQRSQSIEVKNQANEVLMHWRYAYDKAGNITKRQTELGDTSYRYDKLNRLIQVTPAERLKQLGLPDEAYEYDAVHNRQQSGHQGGVWQYNQDNQLTKWGAGAQQTEISYTATGHTESESKANEAYRSYQYNAAERLTKVKDDKNNTELASYQYDPMGRRISKTLGQGNANASTTYYIYSEQGLLAELNSQGQMQKAYGWQAGGLWGTDPLWQAEVAANKTLADAQTSYHYLHTDHLGTPQLATDKNGSTSWRAVSEAFGNAVVESSSQITMNLRFPGQYYDAETGLHQNYFRDYNSATGRYVQGDPIGLEAGVNLYGYVEGNPLLYGDPTGQNPFAGCLAGAAGGPIGCAGGAAIGGAILIGGAIIAGGGPTSSTTSQECNPLEECKDDCVKNYSFAAGLCSASYLIWGKSGHAVCMKAAGDNLAKCMKGCDGK